MLDKEFNAKYNNLIKDLENEEVGIFEITDYLYKTYKKINSENSIYEYGNVRPFTASSNLQWVLNSRKSELSFMALPGEDHAIRTIQKNGKRVLIMQPYKLTHGDLVELMNMCKKFDLEVLIDTHSNYYPGSTLCVCVCKK